MFNSASIINQSQEDCQQSLNYPPCQEATYSICLRCGKTSPLHKGEVVSILEALSQLNCFSPALNLNLVADHLIDHMKSTRSSYLTLADKFAKSGFNPCSQHCVVRCKCCPVTSTLHEDDISYILHLLIELGYYERDEEDTQLEKKLIFLLAEKMNQCPFYD